jgi:protein involved in polysaccharide export with SLBB domain
LRDILSGKEQDILLQKEDVLTILSKNDIKQDDYVEIAGAVNQAGIYPYSNGMKLKDLILKARGFNKDAAETRVEISRKLKDNLDKSQISQIIVVNISKEFDDLENENNIILSPFDHINVRTNPNLNEKEFVYVDGQVNYPGLYAIQSKSERISDLLKRAGGVNEFAYVDGATLVRKTEYYKKETKFDKLQLTLLGLKDNVTTETDSLSESDSDLLKRINSDLDKLSMLSEEDKKTLNKTTNLAVSKKNDSLQPYLLPKEELFKTTESIAIDLIEIIKNNGSISDLLVQSGDTLFIPKKLETVRLRGQLLNPTTVRHQKNKTTRYYINNAGGFKPRADKSKTYVIYPNGLARATKKFLIFNIYPKVVAGSEIIVPQKLEKKSSVGIGNLTGIFTGVATLVLAITQIN